MCIAWLRYNIGNRISKDIANYDSLAHPFAHRAAVHGRNGTDMSANQQRPILDCIVHARFPGLGPADQRGRSSEAAHLDSTRK